MRMVLYLIGVFASLLAGLALASLSGSLGVGVASSAVVFLVAAYLVWERQEHGDEAGSLRDGEEGRVHARSAGAYSQAGHGGYFGSDGGGFDGGEAVEAADPERIILCEARFRAGPFCCRAEPESP